MIWQDRRERRRKYGRMVLRVKKEGQTEDKDIIRKQRIKQTTQRSKPSDQANQLTDKTQQIWHTLQLHPTAPPTATPNAPPQHSMPTPASITQHPSHAAHQQRPPAQPKDSITTGVLHATV